MAEDTLIWIENTTAFPTNFSSERGSFKLAPCGIVGSVISIKQVLADDPYVDRAIHRAKLKKLSTEEAQERRAELIDDPELNHHHEHEIMRHLREGAMDNTDRYRKKLPEEAEQSGPKVTAEELFGKDKGSRPQTVHRHIDTVDDTDSSDVVSEAKGKLAVTVRPKAKEGELDSNTQNF